MATEQQTNQLLQALDQLHAKGGVEIMKASAGSGKTFSLAREYIRLILTKEEGEVRLPADKFRSVLAVTFTNKATGEMKDRIIKELNILATDAAESDFLGYLMCHCGFDSEQKLSAAAGRALSAILNDYGSFAVTTIDKFFQMVLKAFAREIGQFPDYQIELDRDSLVSEAADKVLDSLTEESPELLNWLSSASARLIEEGENKKMRGTIGEFAKGLFSETFAAKTEKAGIDQQKAFSEENLKLLMDLCSDIVKEYPARYNEAYEAFAGVMSEHVSDMIANAGKLIGKFLSPDFHKRITYKAFKPGSTYEKGLVDGETCFRKGKGTGADHMAVQQALQAFKEFLEGKDTRVFNTALILRTQVYVYRMATDLRKAFEDIQREKGLLGLEDTNKMLKDIIAGTDTPFIYAKMGVKFRHFLLDEFQDTSRIQWDNFLPLLRNSISEGCYNLVVGDVKQSIYRWRNADWKILESEVSSDLGRFVQNPLGTNWRSAKNVVEFNNMAYQVFSDKLASLLGSDKIRNIYAGVRQELSPNIRKKGLEGSVEMSFYEKGCMQEVVVAAVKDAMARGFEPKDIGVLVRKNSEGGLIARALKAEGIDVITNDSLNIGSSSIVMRLAAQLSILDNPQDKIHAFPAKGYMPEGQDKSCTLEEKAEQMLRQIRLEYSKPDPEHGQSRLQEFYDQSAYILAFMDLLRDFESQNGNTLDGFMKYWYEVGRNKSISSSAEAEAVTVMTIHKSKGLEFPFVVVYQDAEALMKTNSNETWEVPQVAGTRFESLPNSIYRLQLSDSSESDLFAECYHEEKEMAYVDSLNTAYVATTRPRQALHIVAPKFIGNRSAPVSLWENVSGMADAFWMLASSCELEPGRKMFSPADPISKTVQNADGSSSSIVMATRFVFGNPGPKVVEKKDKSSVLPLKLVYDCLDVAAGEAERPVKVRISNDAKDFFGKDGIAGASASNRIRGSVLHKVLETVYGPEDLAPSLRRAVNRGELTPAEAAQAEALLSKAISEVEHLGWFCGDPSRVRDERAILTISEEAIRSKRPDRVVMHPDGKVDIIDYKFGKPEARYQSQVGRYAQLYRSMGYGNVRAFLWYIDEESTIKELDAELF